MTVKSEKKFGPEIVFFFSAGGQGYYRGGGRVDQKTKKSQFLFFAGVDIIDKYIKNINLNFQKKSELILITLKDPKKSANPL